MANFKKTIEYFPEELQDAALYKKIAEIVDDIRDQRLEEFKSIANKYKDPTQLSDEALEASIDELGYGYILKAVDNLSSEDLANLYTLISVVHLFKGHRDGLVLILDLLGFSYDLNEWWELVDRVENPPYTFRLEIDFNNSQNVDNFFNKISDIVNLVKNYVYPLMILRIIFEAFLADMTIVTASYHSAIVLHNNINLIFGSVTASSVKLVVNGELE